MIEQQQYSFKIVIAGPQAVGKSSIFVRYCDDTFEESYFPTIGVDFRFKKQQIKGHICKIQIWDTAGQEKFHTIIKTYYRNAKVVIIVYDTTDPKSFVSVQQYWANQAKQNANQECLICLVGNKADLPARTNRDIIQSYASDMNYPQFIVSAKTGSGINQLFESICQKLIEREIESENIKKEQVGMELGERERNQERKKCGC